MAYEELFTDLWKAARIVLQVRAEKCERMGSVPSVPAFRPRIPPQKTTPRYTSPLKWPTRQAAESRQTALEEAMKKTWA